MNSIHKRRLYTIGWLGLGVVIASSLVLYALKENINVYLTPSQLAQMQSISPQYYFRLGGMVKKGTVIRLKDELKISFVVTDFKHEVRVHYNGILPDLFREGKGILSEGRLNAQGIFIASRVLAKHDENYMPKNMLNNMGNKTEG